MTQESIDTKLHFKCSKCQTNYTALPEQAAKKGVCKNCGAPLKVPNPNSENDKTVNVLFGLVLTIWMALDLFVIKSSGSFLESIKIFAFIFAGFGVLGTLGSLANIRQKGASFTETSKLLFKPTFVIYVFLVSGRNSIIVTFACLLILGGILELINLFSQ